MNDLESNLAQFHGSEQWHRHWTNRLIYTDGIDYLQRNATCFWLVDAIASHQPAISRLASKQGRTDILDFQIWVLKMEPQPGFPKAAKLTMYADLPGDPVITQYIEFTDFPLAEIKLYLEFGQHPTLMLPGER
jgi:hypothetical protein